VKTERLTMAQALVKYLCAQQIEVDGEVVPLFGGVFAIFGHGNVAGLGEALYAVRDQLPTYRGHNEQGLGHIAVAYAKAHHRRRMMACTSSIGPGATNMVTAAALAHVNRLPLLFLPGDTFASRAPDPVLQQVEDFGDPGVTANDCFKPVSRYWDRIVRPEQLLTSLPVALSTLLDPAECGPVTLCIPQDVQTEAADYPVRFFEPRLRRVPQPGADQGQLAEALERLRQAKKPLVVAGGGVHYSLGQAALTRFVESHRLPVVETHAGKGALPWDHPCNAGAMGVTGTAAGNALAAEADVVLAVGTRLSDFTTGSRSVLANPDVTLIGLNVAVFDAVKHHGLPLVGDACRTMEEMDQALADWRAPEAWMAQAREEIVAWREIADQATAPSDKGLPTDAQVLGAVNRAAGDDGVVVCAAGGLPGELQKLWRTSDPKGFHLEYGFSCMGYEIPGALGVKMAQPEREIYALIGDGGYLMMNSELATAAMLGQKITLVILDNRGFGCINRLQRACGGEPFNNLLRDCVHGPEGVPAVDFRAHAESLGATAEKVRTVAELEQALVRARQATECRVIVIETDPVHTTSQGGSWWEVAIPEVSPRAKVQEARSRYVEAKNRQRA
jgi:3D-(3,5/4)-trihydroxycyclohexane-1,2-dione acylhydrolase (decyclizing)